MGLASAITVVSNLGYQKYYRPDLLVPIIQTRSTVPVLIATTHKTHVQTGELMGLAWEFKMRETSVTNNSFPMFLLAHQNNDDKIPVMTLEKNLSQISRPFDLWLVNFHGQVDFKHQNCLADLSSTASVNGYQYQLYRCQ